MASTPLGSPCLRRDLDKTLNRKYGSQMGLPQFVEQPVQLLVPAFSDGSLSLTWHVSRHIVKKEEHVCCQGPLLKFFYYLFEHGAFHFRMRLSSDETLVLGYSHVD